MEQKIRKTKLIKPKEKKTIQSKLEPSDIIIRPRGFEVVRVGRERETEEMSYEQQSNQTHSD